jgi:RNA-directed DNA polymerase
VQICRIRFCRCDTKSHLASGLADWGGAYLHKFAWTSIVRHQMVTGTASPDDPTLTEYWANRRRRTTRLPLDRTSLRLLIEQRSCCILCGQLLLHADHPPQTPSQWEQWMASTRKAITKNAITLRDTGTPNDAQLRLVRAHCHRRHAGTWQQPSTPARQPAFGLA